MGSSPRLADLSRAVNKLGRAGRDILHLLGYTHYRLGDKSEAINDYTKAISQGADEPAVWAWRGRAYYDSAQWRNAVDDFTRFTKALGDDPRILSLRGLALAELEDWEGRWQTRSNSVWIMRLGFSSRVGR